MSHCSFVLYPVSPMGKDLDSVRAGPTTFSSMNSSPSREELNQAMRQGPDDLIAKYEFTLADLPPGGKVISGGSVYRCQ